MFYPQHHVLEVRTHCRRVSASFLFRLSHFHCVDGPILLIKRTPAGALQGARCLALVSHTLRVFLWPCVLCALGCTPRSGFGGSGGHSA